MIKMIKILRNKKAVSLMISYVLLISIVVTLSILVSTWIYFQVKNPPIGESEKCDGVSVSAENFCCYTSRDGKRINFTLVNTGRFTVNKTIVRAETVPEGDVFRYSLTSVNSPLIPDNRTNYTEPYGTKGFQKLRRIQLIPFTDIQCAEQAINFNLPSSCETPNPPTTCA